MFTPRERCRNAEVLRKTDGKAVGFTSRFDFAIHVAHARSRGLRRRMPPVLRRRAIDALLQGLCFHYDPLANRVQCSITTLAIECGLATESGAGKLSITRATRALTFLSELGPITYQTEYDPLIGCYIPTDITFTSAPFAALDVSEEAVAAARRSRVVMGKQTTQKAGAGYPGMDELIAKARRFVRERFAVIRQSLSPGNKVPVRVVMRTGNVRILSPVKRQPTREIAEGRFTANREAVKREVERREGAHDSVT